MTLLRGTHRRRAAGLWLAVTAVARADDAVVPWTDTPAPGWPAGVHVSYDVVCPTRITLDASGHVIGSESLECPAPFAKAIEGVLRRWKAEPLAQWGHPDEATLTVAKTFRWTANTGEDTLRDEVDAPTTQTTELARPDVVARWTHTTNPAFPRAAQQQGLTAQVCAMRALVNARGKVIDAVPLDCPPPFDAAAHDALLKWRSMAMVVPEGEPGVWSKVVLGFRATQ